jgi:predicted hydrocarbon binding protein
MKPDKETIDKYNKLLDNPSPDFDIVGGYEVLMAGISKNLPETFGDATAKNFTYQIGVLPGRKIGERIVQENSNEKFENVVEAAVNLMSRLKGYYQFQIENVDEENNQTILIARIKCYMEELYKHRTDLIKGGPLCRINKGYFESALKIMTGKKVLVDQTAAGSEDEMCKLKIVFS